MTTFSIKLPVSLILQVGAKAKQFGVSRSKLIRETLEKMLRQGKNENSPSCYDLMIDFCGIIKTGPTDRSHNKKHFKGYGR